ncbi:MAG: S49 family peptidase [Chthoniobacter sp.]|nr:S49 family peptidase [Chthoniobacter sp.]
MRYDRLFTKLFCKPLLLESGMRVGYERLLLSMINGESAGAQELAIADAEERQPRFAARKMDPVRADKFTNNILEIDGPTATIHIDGAIDKHLSSLDRLCFDATDLNDVDGAIARVASDTSVKNVLFAINSPGGGVNGVPETAGRIDALGKKKNTMALIDGMGCSAACWLACTCHQVLMTPSSMGGSVGVYLALLDESRWLDAQGVRIEMIKDGKLKGAGASFKPLSDDERAHFQAMVNQIGTMFRNDVTAHRPGVSMDSMQGQALFGQSAVDAGLVDGLVSDRAAALAQF